MFRAAIVTAALLLAAPVFAQKASQPTETGSRLTEATKLVPAKSGRAKVNGVEIYYAIHGEGDPLVLLHGGFGQSEMFGPNIPALAAGRQVVAVDLRGHGRTPLPEQQMTFSDLAADVAGLIRHLGFEKADVMGYSLGGAVAIRLAIEHPQLVDRLVAASTAYAFSGWHDFNQQGMKAISAATTAEPMKQSPYFQAYAAVARDPERNWPRLHDQMGRLLGADYDWSAEIAKIQSPTLVVVGDWDSVRTSHAVAFFELLGGGKQDAGWDRSGMNKNRLAVLPNQTHYELFTSTALSDAVIPFLDADQEDKR
jgi:pimeloyl-ACP methyl ester carboxylesterase